MNDQTPQDEWFFADAARQQHGPFGMDELRGKLARGEIRHDTLVWKTGMADWQPLQQAVPDVARAAFATPAAPAIDPLTSQAAIMAPGTEVDRSDIHYAGFWRRVAAYQLDSLILGVASYIVIIPVAMVMGLGLSSMQAQAASDPAAMFAAMWPMLLVSYLLMFAIQAAYFACMHSRPAQATLGKMAVGIKATRPDGGRISFWRGVGRWAGLFLSAIPLGIGYLMAAFTDRKRALHDIVSDTVVVDRWAFTNQPQRQQRGLDGVTIAVLIIMGLMLLFLVGIWVLMLAALAGGGLN